MAFITFLQNYPQSSYAVNAQYWIGESSYITRQFEKAVKDFHAVLDKYPTSNKAADAMLKIGYIHYEMRDYEAATFHLHNLQKYYPKTTAARLAEKRLDRMKKEGYLNEQ